jgi:hypothetical protein
LYVVTQEMAGCWFCKDMILFEPGEDVDIIVIDPETGYPPDYNPETGNYDREITADALDRCTREAVCPSCASQLDN